MWFQRIDHDNIVSNIYIIMSTPFWISKPTILMNKDHISEMWPKPNMTSAEKLNSITRLVIILMAIGYGFTQNKNVLYTGLITIACVVLLNFMQRNKKETFIAEQIKNQTKQLYQMPTLNNPVMNVLPTQIAEEPNRKPAAPAFNSEVEKEINKMTQANAIKNLSDGDAVAAQDIDKRLFQDLGDQFSFDQSMRPFYATANTQIPNDQDAFAQFCYGDMTSCKEGASSNCLKNTYRYTTP